MKNPTTVLSTETIYECSIEGCPRVTVLTRHENPRERWMLNIELTGDKGKINVNLCPVHTKEIFALEEEWYLRMERTEKMIKEGAA